MGDIRDTFLESTSSPVVDCYEVSVLITRGIDMPRKEGESKRHPTYECTLEVQLSRANCHIYKPHSVERFFDQYRTLQEQLKRLGIAEHGSVIDISTPFPPTHLISSLGMRLSEELLDQR